MELKHQGKLLILSASMRMTKIVRKLLGLLKCRTIPKSYVLIEEVVLELRTNKVEYVSELVSKLKCNIEIHDFWTCSYLLAILQDNSNSLLFSISGTDIINPIKVTEIQINKDRLKTDATYSFILTLCIVASIQNEIKADSYSIPKLRSKVKGFMDYLISSNSYNVAPYVNYLKDLENALPYLKMQYSNTSIRDEFLNTILYASGEHKKLLEGFYCTKPTTHVECTTNGQFAFCCPSYLKLSEGSVHDSKYKPLESSLRHRIIESINNGTYNLCSLTECTKIQRVHGDEDFQRTPITAKNEDLKVFLSYDSTCNLWCPSCRKTKITSSEQEADKLIKSTSLTILPILRKASSVMMNGYGDLFASKVCRYIMKECTEESYPSLRYDVITNGVLFKPEVKARFSDFINKLTSVRVSIDAAEGSTYLITRKGGDWDILMDNIKYIVKMRDSEEYRLKHVSISMVVQLANFREISQFYRLGKELRVDMIVYEHIMDWGVLENFDKHAVHLPSSSYYKDFCDEVANLKKIVSGSPSVSWPW